MTTHIVGAGLAGLACAVALAGHNRDVTVYESAPNAGGRCRSFFDHGLDRRLDNGNHLLLSANRAALAYLALIGATDTLTGPAEAAFPFVDLESGRRWVLRPNRGRLPWWVLVPSRRVPGSRLADYRSGLALLTARPTATVADCVDPAHPLYRTFWEPLTLAALNAEPAVAAAAPLRAVLLETFGRGAAFCRPLLARDGLGASLVEPALAFLARREVALTFGRRLRRVVFDGGRISALDFGAAVEIVEPGDKVVLALPATAVGDLLPGLPVPEDGHAIVNAHFRLDRPPVLPEGLPFIGVIGGAAHWVFVRNDVASVTVSGAGTLVERPAADLASLLWADVTRALGLPAGPVPPVRIIKEKRATFVQTPDNQSRRPPTATRWPNLFLAGDWTATGLPATIEGAIRSGFAAAAAIGRRNDLFVGSTHKII
jgi:squalene-associated FAD-dependent desaturase